MDSAEKSGLNKKDKNPSSPVKEVREEVEVRHHAGLHARPSCLVALTASRYKSEIFIGCKPSIKVNGVTIEKQDLEYLEVNAKSLMGVLLIEAGFGQKIIIRAIGVDAEEAVQDISNLFMNGFGELS